MNDTDSDIPDKIAAIFCDMVVWYASMCDVFHDKMVLVEVICSTRVFWETVILHMPCGWYPAPECWTNGVHPAQCMTSK